MRERADAIDAVAPGRLAPSGAGIVEHPFATPLPRSRSGRLRGELAGYAQMMRVDHWFKNAFMLLGAVLACALVPGSLDWPSSVALLDAVAAACLVASSNYVLNEWLDAESDRHHPVKRWRPAARGAVRTGGIVSLWLGLACIGFALAFSVNLPLGLSAAALWIMGCAYNVPPVRWKEVPYLDVLSESVNNPIRLCLGWFALVPDRLPPLSLALCYWMVGAYFMAAKRLAELRAVDDRAALVRYRRSFRHYDESRLLVSMAYYVTLAACLGGVFAVLYRIELVLGIPLYAGVLASYLALGLRKDSLVQHPEHLHRDKPFLSYTLATTAVFVLLLFLDVPGLGGARP